ncbi:MAG: tetratricopeptide repeat protein [Bacteroidota bacterium]
MTKHLLLFFFIICLQFACSNDNNPTNGSTPKLASQPAAYDYGNFSVEPVKFEGTQEQAINQIKTTIDEISADRDEEGYLQTTKIPQLIGQFLGLMEQFPANDAASRIGFDAAEVANTARDYENAARMYHQLITAFPKSDRMGHARLRLGMVLDQKLNQKEAAKAVYRDFIENFQGHPLVGTGEGLLYEILQAEK